MNNPFAGQRFQRLLRMTAVALTFLLVTGIPRQISAQVGIATDGLPPDPSAILDVRSELRGLLPPRMTAAQMLAIPAPARGLVVFSTTSQGTYPNHYGTGLYCFDGQRWSALATSPWNSLPVLTQAQIDTLGAEAGTVVYNSTTQCLNYHTGAAWMSLCGTCTPQPSQANAGGDQTVVGNSAILSATAPASGTGVWSIVSGTGGTIVNATDPHSTFSGLQPGNYTLQWTVTTACGSSNDQVQIHFTNTPPPGDNGILFAPYADCVLWPNYQIQNVAGSGITHYSCAFIVDDQFAAGAVPCWGGYSTLGMTYFQQEIDSLRNQGGDIIMSFGGANGVELSYAASTEFEARDAYKTVIDAYSLTSIDFDIEGFFVAEPASVLRRSKAMKLLQNEYPALRISLTRPVMPDGLTADGRNVVASALSQGVNLHCVNIMAMDYGSSTIDMGDAAISAGNALFSQLKTLYQNAGQTLSDSLIWRKVGVTPMIGQNDVPGEIFTLDDANDLAAWASLHHIGRLAMWSANRDKACVNPNDPLYSCSHISQLPFEFSGIFGGVAANKPAGLQPKAQKSRPGAVR